jgi:hypothetical protein
LTQQVETFTFFFAGHGGVSRGSYYLCVKDTVSTRLATRALSLSQLFQILNETNPLQCNIILDSCQSGGLISDLPTVLKPELLGASNTSGISIFASSASNEYSSDTALGGLGTVQLLRVLRGEITVQTHYPYLDLIEAGRVAAEFIYEESKTLVKQNPDLSLQTPTVWGMNLYGRSRFSQNPLYDRKHPSSLQDVVTISAASPAGLVIKESAERIWGLYYTDPNNVNLRDVFRTLETITTKLPTEQDVMRFVTGIATTLRARSEHSNDLFAKTQLTACCISLLLQFCRKDGCTEVAVKELAELLTLDLGAALTELSDNMRENDRCLAFEGLSDFFYLPLRISKILGWASALLIIKESLGHSLKETKELDSSLVTVIIQTYEECLDLITEEQTPYALTFLYAALQFDMHDEGEVVFSRIANEIFSSKARIARSHLDPTKVFNFLEQKANGGSNEDNDLFAHPSEALAAILIMAKAYDLPDNIDPYLRILDHTPFLVFLPEDHADFAQEVIRAGRNHNFQIGHGIWEVGDFIERWNEVCLRQLEEDVSLRASSVQIGALCSSLLFPDRNPWFLLRHFRNGDLLHLTSVHL